jgi:hypothetical protein
MNENELLETPESPGIPEKVRVKIISAGGLVGMHPTTDDMPDTDELADDYQFDAHKFDLLCIKFQQLVQNENPKASIACDDVSACETVGDCVKLIKDTLAES